MTGLQPKNLQIIACRIELANLGLKIPLVKCILLPALELILFHDFVKDGPDPSNFEDLCLVNVSVKYFIKLCFGTSKIQLN